MEESEMPRWNWSIELEIATLIITPFGTPFQAQRGNFTAILKTSALFGLLRAGEPQLS